MKRLKKLLTIWLAVLLAFCASVTCFTGCEQSESTKPVVGPIPDGTYYWDRNRDKETYIYDETEISELYWEIEGDEARLYSSGWLSERAKIVEKDGKIYFESYKWINWVHMVINLIFLQGPKREGTTHIYLVEYNAEEKSIKIELYKEGQGYEY